MTKELLFMINKSRNKEVFLLKIQMISSSHHEDRHIYVCRDCHRPNDWHEKYIPDLFFGWRCSRCQWLYIQDQAIKKQKRVKRHV